MSRNGVLPNGPFSATKTLSVEHGILWNLRNDPKFCKKVGMPMLGIHVWFERLSTPYAHCDMSGHLPAFFTEKTL